MITAGIISHFVFPFSLVDVTKVKFIQHLSDVRFTGSIYRTFLLWFPTFWWFRQSSSVWYSLCGFLSIYLSSDISNVAWFILFMLTSDAFAVMLTGSTILCWCSLTLSLLHVETLMPQWVFSLIHAWCQFWPIFKGIVLGANGIYWLFDPFSLISQKLLP